jgi:hypothetical protein
MRLSAKAFGASPDTLAAEPLARRSRERRGFYLRVAPRCREAFGEAFEGVTGSQGDSDPVT